MAILRVFVAKIILLFKEQGKREQRVGKRIKQFYLLIEVSQPMRELL